ncbi:MAG: T9SS type A sorting domain-containing protein [Salibacteraceae bacterium]
MKGLFSFFLTFFTISYSLFAQNPIYDWAGSVIGGSSTQVYSLTVDDNGNVYSAGLCSGFIDIDPEPGVVTPPNDLGSEGFVQKLDANGTLQWYFMVGENTSNYARILQVSVGKSGNILALGEFYGTIDFDPGPGVVVLDASPNGNALGGFLLTLDPAGNFLSVVQVVPAWAFDEDDNENLYFTGRFSGSIDRDPGPGVQTITSLGSFNSYAYCLDQQRNLKWFRHFETAGSFSSWDVAADGQGNSWYTGHFGGTVDCDPGPGSTLLTSEGRSDVFVVNLDAQGQLVWGESAGGTNTDEAQAIKIDPQGNIVIGGTMGSATADFDFGPALVTLSNPLEGTSQFFVAKYTSTGDIVYAKSMGLVFSSRTKDRIDVDAYGQVYATGNFYNEVDLDPGLEVDLRNPSGAVDQFVLKLNANGSRAWVTTVGGTTNDDQVSGTNIAVSQSGDVWTTGTLRGTIDFDPGPGVATIQEGGSSTANNISIFKLKQVIFPVSAGQDLSPSGDGIQPYPNPSNGWVSLELESQAGAGEIHVCDMEGRLVKVVPLPATNRFDVELPAAAGVYFLEVMGDNKTYPPVKVIRL